MGDKGKMTKLQDANGKTFDIDISKINDINGDAGNGLTASISDNIKNRVVKAHDVEYCDSNGNIIDSTQLLKDVSSGKRDIIALDVLVEATHSGKNHNYCIYYEDSMEKDAESFINPFRKPMLKNHNDYSGEPIGRVTQSWAGPSQITDERSAIHLKTRVSDQDAMMKFLDGRYSTVSIGGTMGTITCNICGKTILKDGKFKFCGHWRGETYKDEICYWGAKDIEYHEVSVVNNPADDYAQVMKVTVITDSNVDNKDNKEGNTMGEKDGMTDSVETKVDESTSTTTQDSASVGENLYDVMDNILDQSKDAKKETSPETVEDNQETVEEVKDNEETIEDIKAKLTDALEKLEQSKAELATAKDSLETKEVELKEAQAEIDDAKDKCIALAVLNKELVTDSIISTEISAGITQKENKDSRKEELIAMSMKDLKNLKTKQEDSAAKAPRQQAHVENPTLAMSDETQDSNSGKTADAHKNTDSVKTVNDYAAGIINKLVK